MLIFSATDRTDGTRLGLLIGPRILPRFFCVPSRQARADRTFGGRCCAARRRFGGLHVRNFGPVSPVGPNGSSYARFGGVPRPVFGPGSVRLGPLRLVVLL